MPWVKTPQDETIYMEYDAVIPPFGQLKVTAPKRIYSIAVDDHIVGTTVSMIHGTLSGREWNVYDDSTQFLYDENNGWVPIVEDEGRTVTIVTFIDEPVPVTIKIVCRDY
jgi:hypothetical protein